jgi:hypothetical protein
MTIPSQHRDKGTNDPDRIARRSSRRGGGYWARATSTPAGLREALDELAEAFPVDDVSPAPWVVERGPITWMIREGTGGAQIGNFILEADARYVAEARNRAALQGADR